MLLAKNKIYSCPPSEGCSQSVFFFLSGLTRTGPEDAIFVSVTAREEGGGVGFK